MRALLLAAGLGTRLRPITDAIPKCLVPIHGRALIDYWLDLLCGGGIERVLVNTHHFAEVVESYIARSPWRDWIETVHESELLGTGGALAANRDFFGSEPVLLAHADNLTDFDVAALQDAHACRPAGCAMTMLAFRTDEPRSCGVLELDAASRVVGFHEKLEEPPGTLANGAVYILEPEVADFTARLGGQLVDFSTEVIPHFVGRILAWEHPGYHRDVGTPEALAKAHTEFPTPSPAERSPLVRGSDAAKDFPPAVLANPGEAGALVPKRTESRSLRSSG